MTYANVSIGIIFKMILKHEKLVWAGHNLQERSQDNSATRLEKERKVIKKCCYCCRFFQCSQNWPGIFHISPGMQEEAITFSPPSLFSMHLHDHFGPLHHSDRHIPSESITVFLMRRLQRERSERALMPNVISAEDFHSLFFNYFFFPNKKQVSVWAATILIGFSYRPSKGHR